MLFLTHLVAAALAGRLSRLSTGWLVVGAALPDLLDKPLGALGVFELYHSIGHSAGFALFLVPIALYGRSGIAVFAGWGSHLLLDAVHVVVNGRPGHALFLLWPVTESTDPLGIPPGEFFWYYVGTPSFYIEVVLWASVVGLLLSRWFPERPFCQQRA